MRRTGGTLRSDRSPPLGTTDLTMDDAAWGFYAIDGLPDVEEASGVGPELVRRFAFRRLCNGDVPPGLSDEVMNELAYYGVRRGASTDGRQRELTVYELAVADAYAARRDAAVRLNAVLTDDLSTYDTVLTGILEGGAIDHLHPAVGGVIRRTLSDAMAEFEAARHRYRLALVAVAVDNGMSAAQIGEAFAFSRQLASRYLKEAREEWPGLRAPASSRQLRSA